MTVSEQGNKAFSRNEALITAFLNVVDRLPGFVPMKGNIQQHLEDLRSIIMGLRPARIMVIGRSRSGKSSLINAICGLKVAKTSDTKPETGKAEWKEYYHNGTDLVHILDTRGLLETEVPRQADSAKTPYESIMQAVAKECPDVVLFLCKATEVYTNDEDINICQQILVEIEKKSQRNLPVIGVLTKCDELAPPGKLPTDNQRKNRNIQDQVQSFYAQLKARDELRRYVKAVVPTCAYAEYEDGLNGLILPDEDYRWNITELLETMIKYTPREIRGTFARMAHIKDFQIGIANTMVTACNVLCGLISANPIPGSAMPVVGIIQTFMVMYIGWLGGREFSEETVKELFLTTGIGIGANAGLVGIADLALNFVPGFGSLISGTAAAIATKGLGDTAIAFFLEKNIENPS